MSTTPTPTGVFDAFPCKPTDILCVDIGGSAIKTAVIHAAGADELWELLNSGRSPQFIRTDWNPKKDGASNVVEIIRRSIPPGEVFSAALLSLPGEEVSPNGRETRSWLRNHGMPVKLAAAIEAALDLPPGTASLCHDTLAWGLGVRALLASQGKHAGRGVGVLAVGTGVAYSFVRTTSVVTRHLHARKRYDWNKLARFANFKPSDWIHNHLGTDYFRWRDQKFNDPHARQRETQKRFQLLLDELERVDQLSAFIFAGGLANELSKCRFKQDHVFLTQSTLGFEPGFIPILGMLS